MEDNITDTQRKDIQQYTLGMILPRKELLEINDLTKLKLLQITPDKAIKKREVAWNEIPYVTIWYIERALNFVSNFQRGLKVQREWFKEYIRYKKIRDKSKKSRAKDSSGKLLTEEQKVFDARCIADFYIVLDWKRIERSCYWTWQMFENPAVSDFSVIEASRSQATKSFADTLGIWSDALINENEKIQEARRNMEIIEAPSLDEIAQGFNQ